MTIKKARVQKHKKGIYLFSFTIAIVPFVVIVAFQHHKEIVSALEFVKALF